MEIRLVEQTADKTTSWGVIQKSLKQHVVMLLNEDNGKFTQCGYVGTTHFLPLAGFPQELVDDVAALCSQQLNRDVQSGRAPLSYSQLAEKLEQHNAPDEEDEDYEPA